MSGWPKTLRKLLLTPVLIALLVATGFHPSQAEIKFHRIWIDSRFSNSEKESLAFVFNTIESFPFDSVTNSPLANLLELEELSSQSVLDFASSWVHFLIPSTHGNPKGVTKRYWPGGFVEAYLISSGALAKFNQMQEAFLSFSVSEEDFRKLELSDHRLGVVQVFSDFFEITGPTPEAKAILQFSYLMHEAGHSRGDGFPHVNCKGFINFSACDDSSNGPNAIQAAFLDEVVRTCGMIKKDPEKFSNSKFLRMCTDQDAERWLIRKRDNAIFLATGNPDFAELPKKEVGTPLSDLELREILQFDLEASGKISYSQTLNL